ncbi:MAG: hypothetical protein N2167_00335 [Flavobacteriales bacterium]|nr:hypothetical protein [Flavobacteriales bacterium]
MHNFIGLHDAIYTMTGRLSRGVGKINLQIHVIAMLIYKHGILHPGAPAGTGTKDAFWPANI